MLGRTHEIDQDALSETLGKCGVGEGQQRAFLKSCQALLSEAGPSGAKFAFCSLRRALLMPQVDPGSLYRRGKRT